MTLPEGNILHFGTVDQEPDPAFFIQFLDRMNGLPAMEAEKLLMIERLRLGPGSQVLELGCGTGDDARRLAGEVGPQGRVVGIDVSQAMVAEARRRAEGSGLPVEFRVGDATALDLPDGAFDAVRSERMFLYVPDPATVLAEIRRTTRSGGRVVVSDLDLDTIVFDHPDPQLARRMVGVFADGFAQGRIGRRLPALFRQAGLRDVEAAPLALSGFPYDLLISVFHGALAGPLAAGAINREEVERLWAGLEDLERAGGVFFVLTTVIVSGTTP
jgi:SAM-dependent methyltransferase